VLLGRAERQHAAVVALQVRLHLHPVHVADVHPLDEASLNPVGSGAYRFVEWVKDDRLVLERAPNFTRRDTGFERLVWRVIPEASTRAAELIAGNVDIVDAVAPDQIGAVDASDRARSMRCPGTTRVFVGFNMGSAFDGVEGGAQAIRDTAVRVALQYAVDVPTICGRCS
jgi:peptide/nickel transport system substrate-binding protein